MDAHNILSEKQSGFWKNRSCTTAVLKITEDIRLQMDRCNITLLTLLDFSKALDTVNQEILLTKLSRLLAKLMNVFVSVTVNYTWFANGQSEIDYP